MLYALFLQSSDHWDKLPFLYSPFIFIHLLLSLISSILVLGQTKDKECIFKQCAVYFRKPVQSPWWEWKHSQRYFDLLCFPETLWTVHIWSDPSCLFEVFTLLTDGSENPQCRVCPQKCALYSWERSLSAIEIQCLFHNLLSVSCCNYCGIIFFSLPLSVSSPEKHTDCGLESQCHLYSLFSLEWRDRKGAEGSEQPSGRWQPQCTTRDACKMLVCTGYLQHLASFLDRTSDSEGLCQRAVLLVFWLAMRSLCAASRRKPSMTCLSIHLCKCSVLWRLCWSWINCTEVKRAFKCSSRQTPCMEVCSITINYGVEVKNTVKLGGLSFVVLSRDTRELNCFPGPWRMYLHWCFSSDQDHTCDMALEIVLS